MLRYMTIVVLSCLLQVQANEDSRRIIIIGSGPSAIAAGTRLLENGFNNLTILEAENRIGGRVYTREFAGYSVDIGAQWVHGEENNAVFELVWPLGLLEKSAPERNSKIFSSQGIKMADETSTNLMDYFINLVGLDIPVKYDNTSVGAFFTEKLDEYFKTHPDIKEEQHGPLKDSFNLMEMALDAGDTWFNVTTDPGYDSCKGDQMINWKDRTYGTIIDILTKKYPNPADELPFRNKTVLDAEVSKIKYNNGDGTVRVTIQNGDEYTADHVIVTPSLGVLKADHEKLFDPPLPEKKVNAIKGIEFGSVAKIYLSYPEPWWPEPHIVFGYNLYWTEEDRNAIANDPKKSWMLGVYSVISVEHKPKLLCLWVTGPKAREMETISEENIMTGAKELLHRFFGKTFTNMTEPTGMMRSQWFTNKHFRGTYSYKSPETKRTGAKAVDLEEPIMEKDAPRVMFAGEATSTDQFSTVHGAIRTGWREADRLMEHYGREVAGKKETTQTS